jgi:hypothetical protein
MTDEASLARLCTLRNSGAGQSLLTLAHMLLRSIEPCFQSQTCAIRPAFAAAPKCKYTCTSLVPSTVDPVSSQCWYQQLLYSWYVAMTVIIFTST